MATQPSLAEPLLPPQEPRKFADSRLAPPPILQVLNRPPADGAALQFSSCSVGGGGGGGAVSSTARAPSISVAAPASEAEKADANPSVRVKVAEAPKRPVPQPLSTTASAMPMTQQETTTSSPRSTSQAPSSPARSLRSLRATWTSLPERGAAQGQQRSSRRRLSLMSILVKKDDITDAPEPGSSRRPTLSPSVSFTGPGDIMQTSPTSDAFHRSFRSGLGRWRSDISGADESPTANNRKPLTNANVLRSLELLRQSQSLTVRSTRTSRALPPRKAMRNDFTGERLALARRHQECIELLHKIFELCVGDFDPDLSEKVEDALGPSVLHEERDCLIYYKHRFCTGQLLHFAVWLLAQDNDDSPDWVRLCLDAGADARAWATYLTPVGPNYMEPVHIAAGLGSVRALSSLAAAVGNLETSALLNAYTQLKNANFYAPIHEAAFTQQKCALKWLLDHKADANAKNRDGFTPLHWLAFIAHPPESDVKEMVNCLVDAGADLCERTPNLAFEVNFHYKTPLEMAVLPGSKFPKRLMYLLTPSFQELAPDPANPLARKRKTVNTVFEDLCLLSSHNEVAAEELSRQILKAHVKGKDQSRINQVRVDAQKDNSVDCFASLIHMAPRAAEGISEILMVRPEVANAGHHPISSRAILGGRGLWHYYTTDLRCSYQRDAITKLVNSEEITWPVWDFDSTRSFAEQVELKWQRHLMRVPDDLNARQASVKDVDTKVLLMPNILNINIFKALAMTWHTQIFAKLPIQSIVWCMWDNVVLPVYLWTYLFNVVELVMLAMWCLTPTKTHGETAEAIAVSNSPRQFGMFWIIVLAHLLRQTFNQGWFMFVAISKWRAYRFSWLQYKHNSFATLYYLWTPTTFASRHSFVEMCHYIMRCILVGLVITNPEGEMTDHEQELLAFVTLFSFMFCVYGLNVMRGCEPIIAMQSTVMAYGPTQLMFGLIFLFFLGLTFTFRTLRRRHDMWWIAIFLYRALLFGDGDGFDHMGLDPEAPIQDHVESEVLIMVGTVFVYVALLNLLIAVFEAEYRKYAKEAELLGLQKRAEFCCRYLLTMKKLPELPWLSQLMLVLAPILFTMGLAVVTRRGVNEFGSGVFAAILIAAAEIKWQGGLMHNDWFSSQHAKMARVVIAAVGHGDLAEFHINGTCVSSAPRRGITMVTVSHASLQVISTKTYDIFGDYCNACEALVEDLEELPLGRIVLLSMRSSVTSAPVLVACGGDMIGEDDAFFDFSADISDLIIRDPVSIAFTVRWDDFPDEVEARREMTICILDFCSPSLPSKSWSLPCRFQLQVFATGTSSRVKLSGILKQEGNLMFPFSTDSTLLPGEVSNFLITVSEKMHLEITQDGYAVQIIRRPHLGHSRRMPSGRRERWTGPSGRHLRFGRCVSNETLQMASSPFKGRIQNIRLWHTLVDWYDAFEEAVNLSQRTLEALRTVGVQADLQMFQGYALIGRKGVIAADSVTECWGHQAVAEKAILRTGALLPGRRVILQNPTYASTVALGRDGSSLAQCKRPSVTALNSSSSLSGRAPEECFKVIDAGGGYIALFCVALHRFLCVNAAGRIYGSHRGVTHNADARLTEVDAGGGMIALHSPQGPGWYIRVVADLPPGMSFSGPLHGMADLRTIEGKPSKLPDSLDGECELDIIYIDGGPERFCAPHFLWACHTSDFNEDKWQVNSDDAQMAKMAEVEKKVSNMDERLKELGTRFSGIGEKLHTHFAATKTLDLGATAQSLADSVAEFPSPRLLKRVTSRKDTTSSVATIVVDNDG